MSLGSTRMSARSWARQPCMFTCGKTLFTPCSAETSDSMICVAMLTLMGMTKLGSQPWVSVVMVTP